MLEQLSQEKIKENWKKYKSDLETAFVSSEGTNIVTGDGSQDIYTVIYNRLINPSDPDMHLWSEGNEDYIVLTQLQECEITGKQTLVLFSATRTQDVDKDLLGERYYEAYVSISKFARDHNCVGMYCYSDLEYFLELAKTTKDWTNVITRYHFIFPL